MPMPRQTAMMDTPKQRLRTIRARYSRLGNNGARVCSLMRRSPKSAARDSVEPYLDFFGKRHGSTESRPTVEDSIALKVRKCGDGLFIHANRQEQAAKHQRKWTKPHRPHDR